MLTRITILLCLCTEPLAIAQARPTATKAGDLQIGGGLISANSDYDGRFKGFFGYADFDATRHLGAEFEIHQIYSSDGQQIHERTYEVGARYRRKYGPIVPYAKIMVGRGIFKFPYTSPTSATTWPPSAVASTTASSPRQSARRVRIPALEQLPGQRPYPRSHQLRSRLTTSRAS